MSTKYLLTFALFLCFAQFATSFSAKLIYKALDEENKKYFLQYLLAKGYEETTRETQIGLVQFQFPDDLNIPEYIINMFEVYDITPDSFAKEFYFNFKQTFNLTTTQALGWVMGEIICLPSGECVDTGDAGSVCCT